MSGPKGGERQQHAAAVMEGLLHSTQQHHCYLRLT